MIWTLITYNIRRNYLLFLVISLVMIFYLNIMMGMYDPKGMQVMQELAKLKMSTDMLKGLGFDLSKNFTPGLLEFISQYYYGILIFIFPLLYIITVSNRIIAGMVDDGSLAYILSTPITRKKFAITQGLFLFISIVIMVTFITIFGIIRAEQLFPGLLNTSDFIRLNIGACSMLLLLCSIGFVSTSICNESRKSIPITTAIPVFFLIIQVFSNINPESDYLKNYTFFTLYNIQQLISGYNYLENIIIILGTSSILFVAAVWYFKKKDLPL